MYKYEIIIFNTNITNLWTTGRFKLLTNHVIKNLPIIFDSSKA